MRLGLIGDVHAEDGLLRIALDALQAEGVDRILCTGDIVDGLGDVDRACTLLREANALVVRGNHDRWIRNDEMRNLPHAHRMTGLQVETIALLKDLPSTIPIELPALGGQPAGRLILCHGVGANDMCRLMPEDYGYAISSNEDLLALLFDPHIHVMVGGHTHHAMLRRFERGGGKPPFFVVNAGTVAREHEPGFALLDIGAQRVEFYRIMNDVSPPRVVKSSSGILRSA